MKGFIYKVTNKVNSKVYIGQTIQTVQERWYRHCGKSGLSDSEMNTHFKRAILKYGKESFSIEILEEVDSSKLDEREKYYINLYDSYNNGYNSTLGGQNGGYRPFKLIEYYSDVIKLYKYGFSLREIGREFNVDKSTIKGILIRNNITLRTTRTYKYSQEQRTLIIQDWNSGLSREEIMNKYKISKTYLSQLINRKRRI